MSDETRASICCYYPADLRICRDSFSQWAYDSQELFPLSRSEHFIYYNGIDTDLLYHCVNVCLLALLKESYNFQNNNLNTSTIPYLCS